MRIGPHRFKIMEGKAMFGGLGMQELLIVFAVVLLLFGAKKIPEIAKGLGRGISDFKRAVKEPEEILKGIEDVKRDA